MQSLVDIQVPNKPDDLSGAFSICECRILKEIDTCGIASLESITDSVEWLDEFDWVYFERSHGGNVIRAIRPVTHADVSRFRVPVWIQEPKIPECCGMPMVFVAQINDDDICAEPPPDAKHWWHDSASFYVFTCGQCLGVKAVGQQY